MNKYLFIGIVVAIVLCGPTLMVLSMVGNVYEISRTTNNGQRVVTRNVITPANVLSVVLFELLFIGMVFFFVYEEDHRKGETAHGR